MAKCPALLAPPLEQQGLLANTERSYCSYDIRGNPVHGQGIRAAIEESDEESLGGRAFDQGGTFSSAIGGAVVALDGAGPADIFDLEKSRGRWIPCIAPLVLVFDVCTTYIRSTSMQY